MYNVALKVITIAAISVQNIKCSFQDGEHDLGLNMS